MNMSIHMVSVNILYIFNLTSRSYTYIYYKQYLLTPGEVRFVVGPLVFTRAPLGWQRALGHTPPPSHGVAMASVVFDHLKLASDKKVSATIRRR